MENEAPGTTEGADGYHDISYYLFFFLFFWEGSLGDGEDCI